MAFPYLEEQHLICFLSRFCKEFLYFSFLQMFLLTACLPACHFLPNFLSTCLLACRNSRLLACLYPSFVMSNCLFLTTYVVIFCLPLSTCVYTSLPVVYTSLSKLVYRTSVYFCQLILQLSISADICLAVSFSHHFTNFPFF